MLKDFFVGCVSHPSMPPELGHSRCEQRKDDGKGVTVNVHKISLKQLHEQTIIDQTQANSCTQEQVFDPSQGTGQVKIHESMASGAPDCVNMCKVFRPFRYKYANF